MITFVEFKTKLVTGSSTVQRSIVIVHRFKFKCTITQDLLTNFPQRKFSVNPPLAQSNLTIKFPYQNLRPKFATGLIYQVRHSSKTI